MTGDHQQKIKSLMPASIDPHKATQAAGEHTRAFSQLNEHSLPACSVLSVCKGREGEKVASSCLINSLADTILLESELFISYIYLDQPHVHTPPTAL